MPLTIQTPEPPQPPSTGGNFTEVHELRGADEDPCSKHQFSTTATEVCRPLTKAVSVPARTG